jgi:hypothetical protein
MHSWGLDLGQDTSIWLDEARDRTLGPLEQLVHQGDTLSWLEALKGLEHLVVEVASHQARDALVDTTQYGARACAVHLGSERVGQEALMEPRSKSVLSHSS